MSDDRKKGNGEKEYKTISFEQFYALCSWMTAKAEVLMKEKPSEKKAAEMASTELGFPISDSTVGRAKKATGVKWISPTGMACNETHRRKQEELGRLKDKVEQLETSVIELLKQSERQRGNIDTLRSLVNKLYSELEVTPPPGYSIPPKDVINRTLVNNVL